MFVRCPYCCTLFPCSSCFSLSTTFSSLRECLPSMELCDKLVKDFYFKLFVRSHGVMVSTLDSESSDPSSHLGGTFSPCIFYTFFWPMRQKGRSNFVDFISFTFCMSLRLSLLLLFVFVDVGGTFLLDVF